MRGNHHCRDGEHKSTRSRIATNSILKFKKQIAEGRNDPYVFEKLAFWEGVHQEEIAKRKADRAAAREARAAELAAERAERNRKKNEARTRRRAAARAERYAAKEAEVSRMWQQRKERNERARLQRAAKKVENSWKGIEKVARAIKVREAKKGEEVVETSISYELVPPTPKVKEVVWIPQEKLSWD